MKAYFRNRSYAAIYLQMFGDKFAATLIEVFTGALFYSLGMPLHFILLFFALRFGFMGLFSPLAPILVARYGIARTIALSYVPLGVFFFVVAQAEHSLMIGFFSFIFEGLARGIAHPCIHAVHAVYVSEKTRGRQQSLEFVLGTLASLSAIAIGSFILSRYPYFWLATIAIAMLMLSAIPYWVMLKKVPMKESSTLLEPYRYLASKEWRENLVPFSGHAMIIIGVHILVPLFIFTIAGTFTALGIIMGTVVILELVTTFMAGRFIDRFGRQAAIKRSSQLHYLAPIGFLLVKSGIGAFIMQAYSKITYNLFTASYVTSIHQKIMISGRPFLYATAKEMTLCFAEIILLGCLALTAFFFGTAAFAAGFLLWLIGILIAVSFYREKAIAR